MFKPVLEEAKSKGQLVTITLKGSSQKGIGNQLIDKEITGRVIEVFESGLIKFNEHKINASHKTIIYFPESDIGMVSVEEEIKK